MYKCLLFCKADTKSRLQENTVLLLILWMVPPILTAMSPLDQFLRSGRRWVYRWWVWVLLVKSSHTAFLRGRLPSLRLLITLLRFAPYPTAVSCRPTKAPPLSTTFFVLEMRYDGNCSLELRVINALIAWMYDDDARYSPCLPRSIKTSIVTLLVDRGCRLLRLWQCDWTGHNIWTRSRTLYAWPFHWRVHPNRREYAYSWWMQDNLLDQWWKLYYLGSKHAGIVRSWWCITASMMRVVYYCRLHVNVTAAWTLLLNFTVTCMLLLLWYVRYLMMWVCLSVWSERWIVSSSVSRLIPPDTLDRWLLMCTAP